MSSRIDTKADEKNDFSFTEAAAYLDKSLPFFMRLVEREKIHTQGKRVSKQELDRYKEALEKRLAGLDEMARLNQEMGLYDPMVCTIEVSESMMFYLRQRAERRGMSPDEYAERILDAFRTGEIGEGWKP